MPIDPAAFDAIAKLGVLGFALVAIFALYTRRVRPNADFLELREDRDAWKAIATSSLSKLDRLTDVVETLSGKKFIE